MSKYIGKQAIVIGAGMGGLTAAKALAGHFERVWSWSATSFPGPGTPLRDAAIAARSVLLCGGAHRLGQLFPGFDRQLTRAGAVVYDATRDLRFDRPGYDPFPQRSLGLTTLCASRPLIEFVTRQMLRQRDNVTLRERCRVQNLTATADRASYRRAQREQKRPHRNLGRRSRRRCLGPRYPDDPAAESTGISAPRRGMDSG